MRRSLLLVALLLSLTACSSSERELTFTQQGGVTQVKRTVVLEEDGTGVVTMVDNRAPLETRDLQIEGEALERLHDLIDEADLEDLETPPQADLDPGAVTYTIKYKDRTLTWDTRTLGDGAVQDLVTELAGYALPRPDSPLNAPYVPEGDAAPADPGPPPSGAPETVPFSPGPAPGKG